MIIHTDVGAARYFLIVVHGTLKSFDSWRHDVLSLMAPRTLRWHLLCPKSFPVYQPDNMWGVGLLAVLVFWCHLVWCFEILIIFARAPLMSTTKWRYTPVTNTILYPRGFYLQMPVLSRSLMIYGMVLALRVASLSRTGAFNSARQLSLVFDTRCSKLKLHLAIKFSGAN